MSFIYMTNEDNLTNTFITQKFNRKFYHQQALIIKMMRLILLSYF